MTNIYVLHSTGNVSLKHRDLFVGMYMADFLKEVGQSAVLRLSPLFGSAGCIIYRFGASTGRVNVSKALWGCSRSPGKCRGGAF